MGENGQEQTQLKKGLMLNVEPGLAISGKWLKYLMKLVKFRYFGCLAYSSGVPAIDPANDDLTGWGRYRLVARPS